MPKLKFIVAIPIALLFGVALVGGVCATDAKEENKDGQQAQVQLYAQVVIWEPSITKHLTSLVNGPGKNPTFVGPPGTVLTLTKSQVDSWFELLECHMESLLMDTTKVPEIMATSGQKVPIQIGDDSANRTAAAIEPDSKEPARMHSLMFGIGRNDKDIKVGLVGDMTPVVMPGQRSVNLRIHLTRTSVETLSGGDVDARKVAFDNTVLIEEGRTAICRLGRVKWDKCHSWGVPWLSELPYVGDCFVAQARHQGEMDVFVIVTPKIVAK
jgi:hypothetical protein